MVRRRHPSLRPLRELDERVWSEGLRGIALEVIDVEAPIVAQLKLSVAQASSCAVVQARSSEPLAPGSQLQNWDCDAREGLFAHGEIEVGSLGAIFEHEQGTLLLSNNHVLAGQNRGRPGDRIASPGGELLEPGDVVARLERFVSLRASATTAHPRWGNVEWNEVDAALARIEPGVGWRRDLELSGERGSGTEVLPRIQRVATPELGDEVIKVGRTTGLTRGRVVGVGEFVGPVAYGMGDCWFRNSFTIETDDGRPFSDAGDSGAAVLRNDGALLGLIYAGNGQQSYACPIDAVLRELALSPAT